MKDSRPQALYHPGTAENWVQDLVGAGELHESEALERLTWARTQCRQGEALWFIREQLRALAVGDWGGPVAEVLRCKAEEEATQIFEAIPAADLHRALSLITWKGPYAYPGDAGEGGPCAELMDSPVTEALVHCFDPDHPPSPTGAPLSQEDRGSLPACGLSWYDAQMFAEWIATVLPGTRLPLDAEWSWFCATDPAGDPESRGWYRTNGGGRPHPVRQKPLNVRGLYDCDGNVWEWCMDEFQREAVDLATLDPQKLYLWPTLHWTLHGHLELRPMHWRVYRGGAWDEAPLHAARDHGLPGSRFESLGFRLIRVRSGG